MSGLQLNVGLFSGINYVDLVNQLIQIDAVPMNRLTARNEVLAMERDALTNTMARFLTTSYMIRNLNRAQPYLRTDVTSSNASLITATRSGNTMPVPGSYTFTPLQMASAQQTVARGVASDTEALGKTGTITIGKGWSVENEVLLQDINGGDGFSKGSIRLIDGSGQRATIDLRKAITVKDVINAINDNHDVDILAELDGDHIVLRDVSGGDPTKMVVQEVSGGNTAASLGLMGRTVDSNGVLTGNTIWRLGENMSLSLLNDGNGVVFDSSLPDLSITCKDGTTVNVDFNRWSTVSGVQQIHRELTVGDLLKTINDAGNGKLNARISDDGKSITIEDKTTGGGLTTILQATTHPVLKSLGLVSDDKTAQVDLFTGLTENGNTAKMYFEDKNGKSAIIELTNTDIAAIRSAANSAGAHNTPGYAYSVIAAVINTKLEATDVEVRIRGNATNDGLYAVDSSGGSGEMVVADRGTDLAARLGLANAQETEGIAVLAGAMPGQIRFTDQTGKSVDITLTRPELDEVKSASDLMTLFSTKLAATSGVGITVALNSAGTGVVFKDTTDGTVSQMMITDHTGSNVASRLGITTTKFDPDVATALGSLLSGAFPGQVEFTDRTGNTATITISQSDLDGITVLGGLAAMFNTKLEAAGIGITAVVNAANGNNGIIFRDTSGGTTQQMEIVDTFSDIMQRLGLASKQTSVESVLAGVTAGEMRFIDQDGNSVDVAFTESELSGITTLADLAIFLNDKIDGDVGIEVEVNGAGTGLVFKDTTSGGTTSPLLVLDVADSGSNFAARLGLANPLANLTSPTTGATPGKIRLIDQEGKHTDIDITRTDLDGITSLADLAALFNDKIDGDVGITVAVNATGTGLVFNDLTGGATEHALLVFDVPGTGNLAARMGLTDSLAAGFAALTPGEIRITDRTGVTATFTIEQEDIDDLVTLADLVDLFNAKIDGDNGIVAELNAAGTAVVFKDTTTGTGAIYVDVDDLVNGTNILDYLGFPAGSSFHTNEIESLPLATPVSGTNTLISGGTSNTAALESHTYESAAIVNHVAESHAIELQSLMQGKTNSIGTFQTRNLLGGMDTVLVSTLNGGFGLAQAKAGGAIEVQDRAGNKANLVFSQTELNSMQTLTDSVKLFNKKLADAGVNITVRINDQKTGLQVVDNTGSSSHNLIFRDVVTSTTVPGTPAVPAIPAVPAVDAISADNGTGGTAQLTFEGTHWMNNFTFGFTTDENEAGYDSAPAIQKFTFYIDEDALQGLTSAEQDELVQAAINAQITSVWSSIFPPSVYGSGEPPKVKLATGLAEQALDDASSGGETAIKTGISGAVMGVTYVPEVPAIPGTPDTVVPNSPNIASSFGLNINSTTSQASGTSLNRQIISYQTPLSELNGGAGVNMLGARIVVTDSLGATATVTFNSDVKTVGDMIDFINVRMGNVKVVAKINETGDGITFEEFAGGTRSFTIADADSTSRFASSLGINKSVGQAQKDADGRLRITASETHHIEVEETDSLDDIRKKINDLNVGYSASILVDGSNTPFRLSISGKQTGAAGAFNVDLSAIGLTTETMSAAKDAMIVYGDASQSTGLVLRSNTNTFKGVIAGMDLTITGVSDTPVTVTSASSNVDVRVSLQTFVENYNKFREELNVDMYFEVNANTGVSGHILWNNPVARAFDRDVTKMLQQVVEGIPGIRSLADLGITMRMNLDDTGVNKETGKLYFDEDKFEEAWARDPEAVQKFFFDEKEYPNADGTTKKVNVGWAQKFSDLADSLVGTASLAGKAQSRLDTLTTTIDKNDQRIAFMEERLEWKRQMYLKQFYAMEQAMARMTTDMNSISNIASAWQSNYSNGAAY